MFILVIAIAGLVAIALYAVFSGGVEHLRGE